MADPHPAGAVFVSYASEDAEAARRICEALRDAGIEVWFDKNELRGGDAWDQKIRRQIKECALFVPVISANTNARTEGYFRLEWKLAVDRSHLMAEDATFIIPVVIDGTSEAAARVPDRFRAVQWTRLRLTETPVEFSARIAKILTRGAEADAAETAPVGVPAPPVRLGRRSRSGRLWPAAAVIAGLGAVAIAMWHPWNRVAQAFASAPPGSSDSEARQLALRARSLFGAVDTNRSDCALAEDLLRQAEQKDPNDAEIWAIDAQLSEYYVLRTWDRSDARLERARTTADRAIRLDPNSFDARLAQAELLANSGPEAPGKEALLRKLHAERPADHTVLRYLAAVINWEGRVDEANTFDEESARLPGGDPIALYDESEHFWFAGRLEEADRAVQAAIAQKPFAGALVLSAWYATFVHGDLRRAESVLAQIDPAALHEDRGCYVAYYVALLRRDWDAAVQRLSSVPRDWLADAWYRGPKAELIGNAHHYAGRKEAAAVEWLAALKLVEAHLANDPTNAQLLSNRALLLAKLGQLEEARRALAVAVEMRVVDPLRPALLGGRVMATFFTLGMKREGFQQLRLAVEDRQHAVIQSAATLRLDPIFDPVRSDPEFQKIVSEAEAAEARDARAVR